MAELYFNKRVQLVKHDVVMELLESNNLVKIERSTGYYSKATIFEVLHPNLTKYDIDLDLNIYPDRIEGIWIDCMSDKTRVVTIDFHRVENVGKLQLMKNDVMSEGAIISYLTRYALGVILGLPSTDVIEQLSQQQQQNTQYQKPNKPVTENKEAKTEQKPQQQKSVDTRIITEPQVKLLNTLIGKLTNGHTECKSINEALRKSIKFICGIESFKDMNRTQFDFIKKQLDGVPVETVIKEIDKLCEKIKIRNEKA